MNPLIKQERMPTIWCHGCSLGILLGSVADVFMELGFNHANTVIVSGIGCTGRTAGYLDFDSVHTTHGRAIAVAEGIKRANPGLNVVVISGDGDIAGIGGNHLLHSSRRNTDIKVICANNEIYGLTGGQLAPSSEKGAVTATSLAGSPYEPANMQGIVTINKAYFYARASPAYIAHMKQCIKEALLWRGFSFVEIKMKCITNDRSPGFRNSLEMLAWLKSKYIIASENRMLKDNELGMVKAGE